MARDNKKADLIEWARFNRDTLAAHHLCATGTTGSIIENELKLEIVKLQSGPLGGDQQIGAMISRGELDLLIFSGMRSRPSLTIPTSKHCCE